MPRVEPFEKNTGKYDRWFEKNKWAYESELQAVRSLMPERGTGVEIGVGTGRFAAPLGIRVGIEPSRAMRQAARKRGIDVLDGVAEASPWENDSFDFALMVTTICFVDSIKKSFKEAWRILKPGGFFLVGFVDKESSLGRTYQREKEHNVFYKMATFYSVDEVVSHLTNAGFRDLDFNQTIFHSLDNLKRVEPAKNGYGEGSFVVVRAKKPNIKRQSS